MFVNRFLAFFRTKVCFFARHMIVYKKEIHSLLGVFIRYDIIFYKNDAKEESHI